MTDKEFKRLGRPQLIDIIYQLQLQVDELTEKNQKLEQALADKHFRISNAGNIAQAALEMSDCFQSAQNAAEQYLNEIRSLQQQTKQEKERVLSQAQAEAEAILSKARAEADATTAQARAEAEELLADTKRSQSEYESAIDVILQAYGQEAAEDDE